MCRRLLINSILGGFIAPGFDKELDEQHKLRDNGHTLIKDLEMKFRVKTNIPNLKIKHNNIIGFFFEINANMKDKMEKFNFVHCQTLLNVMRYKHPVRNDPKEPDVPLVMCAHTVCTLCALFAQCGG